ncbi:hypothetical protein ES332_D08G307800v1 [Gossypium tomentosum]|uniref:Transmembrane protein n=1 Tax=Gossypium tomentosum TaxID=34277 RepID=A0A5D2K1J9_GOSTO|nr:hypothetical protein ES332_D08G307800v1 [Gossypium tomentosum]
MGRIVPLDGDVVIHPALPFALVVAATAATIAIITGLCGFFRKPPPELQEPTSADTTSPTNEEQEPNTTADGGETEEGGNELLPPPPCMTALTFKNPENAGNLMKKSASTRSKLSSTFSVKKHLRSISVREIIEKGKHVQQKHHQEDSLWTKKIILGEKCKVSYGVEDDDEDQNGGNKGEVDTIPAAGNQDAIVDKEKEITSKEE